MTEKLTLAEKNRIYQQRHRAKMREQLGIDKYRQDVRTYMQHYREERNKAEGYVKPEPVVRLAEPARKPPERPKIEIKLKTFNKNKKNTKKQENRIALLKLNLKSKSIRDNTLKTYVNNHIKIYKMFTGDTSEQANTMGGWKDELIKALKNQTYDDGLLEVISYFKEIQQVIEALRDTTKNPNSFKSYVGAITSLLGRLDGSEYDAQYEYASNTNIQAQKEYTEIRDLNELSPEEMAKIQKMKFDNESIASNTKKLISIRDQALYITYMYIPRRLEMGTVRIIFDNKKNTELTSGNYLMLKDTIPDRFIFNNYKTSGKYKQQIVDVPEQVKPYLHKYILKNNFKTNDLLFPIARSNKEEDTNFSKTFTKVFNKVYDPENNKKDKEKTRLENYTNQDLRIAYATYWMASASNKAMKKKISNALSHSFDVNEDYVKTNVKKE